MFEGATESVLELFHAFHAGLGKARKKLLQAASLDPVDSTPDLCGPVAMGLQII